MKTKHYTAFDSVDDLMPYESGKYLVRFVDNFGIKGNAIMYYDIDSDVWQWADRPLYEYTVTHWMAIPTGDE